VEHLRAGITEGPLLRPVSKGNRTLPRPPHPESINDLVRQAVAYAHLRGASDRAIAHQTRHRSLASIGTYVRIHEARTDNAATQLGL
jgi:hypothetical protein